MLSDFGHIFGLAQVHLTSETVEKQKKYNVVVLSIPSLSPEIKPLTNFKQSYSIS